MAIQSVPNEQPTQAPFCLPMEDVNHGNELTAKIRGIVDLVNIASLHPGEVADASISSACWAVDAMLQELDSIVNRRLSTQP